MQVPSRAAQTRFTEFFRAHIDRLVFIAEHFSQDPITAQLIATEIMSDLWQRFTVLEPEDRVLAIYDALYRRIHSAAFPLPPIRDLDYAPIEGEWSPLRPSDAWAATVLLHAAQHVDDNVDWPLLHIMVRAGVSSEAWSRVTQLTTEAEVRRVTAHQLTAHRCVCAAALELAGPPCSTRPRLADGASLEHLLAHWSNCVVCSGFVSLLIPTARLISGVSFTKIGPVDRQRILNEVFAS